MSKDITYPSIDDGSHDDEHAFCTDMTCPCHENTEATSLVGEYVADGLMTTSEADQYYHGKAV